MFEERERERSHFLPLPLLLYSFKNSKSQHNIESFMMMGFGGHFNIFKMFSYRMGRNGCQIAGWIRICYAILAIVDRLLLHLDLDLFLSPTTGLLPISQNEEGLFGMLSLLRFASSSTKNNNYFYFDDGGDTYLWFMHYIGLLNCILLLLGICPRLNAISLFINTCCFHNAHWMIIDGVDTGLGPMARLYNFYLLFLPLHHITIYDGFGFGFGFFFQEGRKKKKESSLQQNNNSNDNDTTWPMWTVWLWQWQSVLVLLGAWVGKIAYGNRWVDGTAMYYVLHCTDECIGFFNPDIIFNRVLPSKILTWSALFIEGISPISIWFTGTSRKVTLIFITMLFVGMDISMTMHTFEWYGILGWYLFLIERDDDDNDGLLLQQQQQQQQQQTINGGEEKSTTTSSAPVVSKKAITDFTEEELIKELVRGSRNKRSNIKKRGTPFWRMVLDGSVFFFILGLAFNMAFPLEPILLMTPEWFQRKVGRPFFQWNEDMKLSYGLPIGSALGIYQDVWSLYGGNYGGDTVKVAVDAYLTNGTVMTWYSPNWQDLTRWEHKRLYNHMAYYKHLPDACTVDDEENGGTCEEWNNLIDMLADTFYNNLKDHVVKLELWEMVEYPPDYPTETIIGWLDTLKRPLIKQAERKLYTWNFDVQDGGHNTWKSTRRRETTTLVDIGKTAWQRDEF